MSGQTGTAFSTMIGGLSMNKEQIFTIFGGTGDLTFRKLLPALYNIEASDDKVFCPRVVVIGRRDYTSETYRTMAREWVELAALGERPMSYIAMTGRPV